MTRRRPTGVPAAMVLAHGSHDRRAAQATTPDVEDLIADIRERMQLDLVLARHVDNRGSNYEWQDGHGRVVCCGSAIGSLYSCKREAVRHLLGSTTC